MRILLIGGTGFSGYFITKELVAEGHEVALFHRGKTKNDLPKEVCLFHGNRENLKDQRQKLRDFRPQVIIDMIAFTQKEAEETLEIFAGVAQRIIVISSQDVYKAYGNLVGLEQGDIQPIPLTEESSLRSIRFPFRSQSQPGERNYDYDKILVEQAYLNHPKIDGTVIRYPLVYGPGDRQHRLSSCLKLINDNRPAILLGEDIATWRCSRCYVENAATAVVLAATNEKAIGQIYNVAEEPTLSEKEWITAIGKSLQWQGDIIPIPLPKLPSHLQHGCNTQQDLIVDTTKIRQELSYREKVSFTEGLEKTIAWEQKNLPENLCDIEKNYPIEDKILQEIATERAAG